MYRIITNKIKNRKYYTVRTILKSNRKITVKDRKSTPLILLYISYLGRHIKNSGMQTLFGLSLPPVACGRAMLYLFHFVCLRIAVSNTYCVVFLLCLRLVSCVPNVASFSGLFICYFPFGILSCLN
jgi:hypothetical protein